MDWYSQTSVWWYSEVFVVKRPVYSLCLQVCTGPVYMYIVRETTVEIAFTTHLHVIAYSIHYSIYMYMYIVPIPNIFTFMVTS